MKTKHLLTALALPVAFAACTSEDLVQTESIVKEDLGNRPMVEGVTLSLGEAQGRAAIANWGTINFVDGDKLGVALIDVYNAADNDPIKRYDLLKNSINTNYIFTSDANGDFSSEAAMVEGNYVFYYPYNTQRTRNQIVTNLPKEQALTQLADGTYSSYPSVLAYSEENGAPIAVAYDFLSAADAGNTLQGTLKQIYATPLITIQNGCTKKVDGEIVPVEMTIKQISLSYGTDGEFILSAPLKFATAIHNAYDEAVADHNTLVSNLFNETIPSTLVDVVKQGSWNTEIKGRTTSDMIGEAVANGTSTEIILTLAEPVTVAAEGTFSFYAVIPAAAYTDTNVLSATVMNGEGLSTKVSFNDATLTAGQRYPEEEINDDNTLNNDIKGMSLTAAVEQFSAAEGVLVSSVDELINAIKNFSPVDADGDGTVETAEKELKIRMSGDAVINKRVADFLKLTTTKALKITFVNDVTIEGTGVVLDPAKDINFSTKATAKSGAAVTLNKSNVEGNLVIASGATATYKASGLTKITNNGTLTVAADVTSEVQNNGELNITESAAFGTLTNGASNGTVAAEINVSANKTVSATTITNNRGAEINNLGNLSATSFTNNGSIVNGSEDNIKAEVKVSTNAKGSDWTGSITNYAKATVGEQNGNIEMMSVNAVLSVTEGDGLVNNDALAAVTDETGDMVVTYTISGEQTNTTIKPLTLENNGVTKVIFDGVTLKLADNLSMLDLDVEIKENSSINSLGGAAAGYILTIGETEEVDLIINTNKKLTVNAGTVLAGYYKKSGNGSIVNNGAVTIGLVSKVVYDAASLNYVSTDPETALSGNVVLGKDITVPYGIVFKGDGKLDLNGKTLTSEKYGVGVQGDYEVEIVNGNVVAGTVAGPSFALMASQGATLTVKDGTYSVGADVDGKTNDCIYANGGKIIVDGGTFYNAGTDNSAGGAVINAHNTTANSEVVVNKGTFISELAGAVYEAGDVTANKVTFQGTKTETEDGKTVKVVAAQ